jgi:hypothetical protein
MAQDIVNHSWFPRTEPPLSGGAESGTWQGRDRQSLGTIARSLVYEVAESKVNSLPSPWSRALQFEQAVVNTRYPTRDTLLRELFGCFATVGLWEMFGLKLEAERVALADFLGHRDEAVGPFARSLHSASPAPGSSLYTLVDGANPWETVYVLRVNGQVIGFTSPVTLLCPAVHLRSGLQGMNWTAAGRFDVPTRYLSGPQRQALADWLQHVGQGVLGATAELQNQTTASQLSEVLGGFINELTGGRTSSARLSDRRGVPNLPPRPTALALLARPAAGGISTSQAVIELGQRRQRPLPETPSQRLVLVDPLMPNRLGVSSSDITLWGSATLESIGTDPEQLRQLYGQEIGVITPGELFLDELFLLPGAEALENSWLPRRLEGQPLVNGEPVTPLLPLQSKVRNLFSSRELEQSCSLRLVQAGAGQEIEVTINLRLEGQRDTYPISRTYPIKEQNLVSEELPVIALWPNLPDDRWRHYVLFCEDNLAGLSVDGFDDYDRQAGRDGDQGVKYFSTDRFPDLVRIKERGQDRGLIPVNTPAAAKGAAGQWKVGIDFGTSFTNFFIDEGAGPERRSLDTRVLSLTLSQKESRQNLLSQYFIPEDMLPRNQNPPTATAISLRGWQEVSGKVPDLFHEARLKVPTPAEFGGAELRTGFKWQQLQYQKPFLKELALLVSSNAAAAGAQALEWSVSYPSAFSLNEVNKYRRIWNDLCTDLTSLTGLRQTLAVDKGNGGLQTEAVAFASYFGNFHSRQMVHTSCLDVGGGTTDISIWSENTLLHQVSIPFAGRSICAQLLQRKPSFLRRLFSPALTASISEDEARARQDRNFVSRLDNIMRYGSDELLRERLQVLRGESNDQLEQFISLLAISIGGIYHYLGTILRGLDQEQRLRRRAPMSVYAGGNGGRLLNWLDQSGAFTKGCEADQLMQRIQQASTGFTDDGGSTTLSGDYKNETACGLISSGVNLKGDFDPSHHDLFAGDAVEINGVVYRATDRIPFQSGGLGSLDGRINSYELQGMEELKRFCANYDQALQDQRIRSLLPLRKLTDLDSLWEQVTMEARSLCLEREGCEVAELEPEPGFILGLRALANTLGRQWAERF